MSRTARLVLLSGAEADDSTASLVLLGDYLDANADVSCRLVLASDGEGSLAAMDDADVVVVFADRSTIAGAELASLQRYCSGGGAVVSVRSTGRTFEHWPELDTEFLGTLPDGEHEAAASIAVEVAPGAQTHPILAEVEPFAAGGRLRRQVAVAPQASVLLLGRQGARCEPVAWSCEGAGRALVTSLGHPADFWELDFLRLLRNGIAWVTR